MSGTKRIINLPRETEYAGSVASNSGRLILDADQAEALAVEVVAALAAFGRKRVLLPVKAAHIWHPYRTASAWPSASLFRCRWRPRERRQEGSLVPRRVPR